MGNWILTKMQRQFSGKRIVFSTNSTGTIRYPYAKLKQQNKIKPQISSILCTTKNNGARPLHEDKMA